MSCVDIYYLECKHDVHVGPLMHGPNQTFITRLWCGICGKTRRSVGKSPHVKNPQCRPDDCNSQSLILGGEQIG